MPRTEVYQLRLTPDEKATLARKAEDRGVSVAQMIREDYGLTLFQRWADAGEEKGSEEVSLARVPAEIEEKLPFEERIQTLVNSGTSLQRATRQAQREYGVA